MKVKELIEELKKQNPDAEISVWDGEYETYNKIAPEDSSYIYESKETEPIVKIAKGAIGIGEKK